MRFIIVLNLFITISYLVLGVLANTKYVKILASDAKVKPRARIPIPSIFAKKYWISGTFFNKENFQGLPMSFYFTGSKCINFPQLKTLSSLKPIGCVMLYKSKDCQGTYSIVSKDMADLNEIGMLDSIGSIKSCPPGDESWKPQYQHISSPAQEQPQPEQTTTPSLNIIASSSNLVSEVVMQNSTSTNITNATIANTNSNQTIVEIK